MVYPLIQMEYMESKVHNAVDFIEFQNFAVKSTAENRPMPRAK
jgi:hypothetical protein